MSISPIAAKAAPSGGITLGDSGLLRCQSLFRTRDLEQGRAHMVGALGGEHNVSYLSRERRLDFRHRQAKIGGISVRSLQYGAGVMIPAPLLPNFYPLQFTLVGECHIWQGAHHSLLPAGSVAIINPGRAFKKAWLPGTRQLLARIDRQLVAREFHTWTGGDDRITSGLVALLLASMPHNKTRAIEAAGHTTAPYFVRRVEQFIEEHACDAIAQRFRNTMENPFAARAC